MKATFARRSLAAALALGLATSAALADVTFRFQSVYFGGDEPQRSNGAVYLGRSGVAMEMHGETPEAPSMRMLFDSERQLLWLIKEREQTYTEWDLETMRETSASAERSLRNMREQMKQMPAPQRAELEKLMAKHPGFGGEPPQRSYVPGGQTATVSGLPCHTVEIWEHADRVATMWVTDPASAGLTDLDLEPLRKMNRFFEAATADSSSNPMAGRIERSNPLALIDQLGGLPVRAQQYVGDQLLGELVYESISRDFAPPQAFVLPGGYTKLPALPFPPPRDNR